MTKIQNTKCFEFIILDFDIVWNLEFVIWCLIMYISCYNSLVQRALARGSIALRDGVRKVQTALEAGCLPQGRDPDVTSGYR